MIIFTLPAVWCFPKVFFLCWILLCEVTGQIYVYYNDLIIYWLPITVIYDSSASVIITWEHAECIHELPKNLLDWKRKVFQFKLISGIKTCLIRVKLSDERTRSVTCGAVWALSGCVSDCRPPCSIQYANVLYFLIYSSTPCVL